MTGVFISYRQSDSKPWALLLRDDLVEVFGPERIFLDRDTLGAGSWREQIERGLAGCKVLLLLIGRGWLGAADAQGRRLDHPDDVHRREIAYALGREGLTVVPVLLDDAPMPTAAELPEDLRALAECQARRLSDQAARREVDVRALAADIERLAGLRRKPAAAGDAGGQERYLPFTLDEAGARRAFADWAKGLLLAPGDFAAKVELGPLAPQWVPFWQVRANVTAVWRGRSGMKRKADATPPAEGRPAGTAAVTTTVDWTEHQGDTRALIDDIVIPAADLPGSAPTLLDAARLPRVLTSPALPDPPAPTRPVTLDRASGQERARELLRAEVDKRVKKELGGDQQEITQLDLRIDPLLLQQVLAPAFEGRYTYLDRTETVWIDAHGGRVDGPTPLAKGKVAVAVGMGLLVLALIVGAMMLWG
jgi:TIR domain